jgi:hypothetical protein
LFGVHGITTIEQLANFAEFELLLLRGFSAKGLKNVKECLEKIGLQLRNESVRLSRSVILLGGRRLEAQLLRVTKTQFVTSKGRYSRKDGYRVGGIPFSWYIDQEELSRLGALVVSKED